MMRFAANEDQTTFLGALDQIASSPSAGFRREPAWRRFDWAADVDRALEENGFFDCAGEPTLGRVAAAALTCRLAALPVLVEAGASSLLRPFLGLDLPRPLAVLDGEGARAVRFLPLARSVLRIGAREVHAAVLGDASVETLESPFAYPMGALKTGVLDWRLAAIDAQAARDLWRVAVAAELTGALKGGLGAVLVHVRERRQFGRPLGSFQAVQHRLAGAATRLEACYWMTLAAADRAGAAEAAAALGYAQESSTKIVYDLHQFMGAMGLTLEHPLHRWTYRARLLRAALGGPAANMRAAATARWETP